MKHTIPFNMIWSFCVNKLFLREFITDSLECLIGITQYV